MSVVTRFAPSPTGRLHVGNIRTALHNFLFARKNRGTFILRIDDTDRERSTDEFDLAIRDDLEWLGLAPDKLVRQSERFDIYEREFEKLKSAGRVYACYETPEELELRRKVLLGRGLPPVYERKPADGPVPEGRAPHWRFRLDHDSPIVWIDLIRGEQKFDPALLSDPVVRREDGSWLYLLPSVIDDIDLGITHVVRGEDHVSNSAVQIQMLRRCGPSRRTSPTKRCWSPRRASCRSGSAPTAPNICARRASSRWRCSTCSRGSVRRSRSSRSRRCTSLRRPSISRPSAGRRRISTRTRSN